ncbi:hypothetical protein [Kocuria oceani]|uniref:Uncharacterized protein n=1 Tax=Kocuria oceani TaxID=988827 RepID=A0ABV9TFF3_9MICC|nr:hypothetical protein [Kocuria oceani]
MSEDDPTEDVVGGGPFLPPLIHVEVHGAELGDLRDFARETGADLGCRATPRREAEGWTVDAYLPEDRLEAARSARSGARVRLEVRENATAVGRERQAEVGTGNRFLARDAAAGEAVRGRAAPGGAAPGEAADGEAARGATTVPGTRLRPVRGLGGKR